MKKISLLLVCCTLISCSLGDSDDSRQSAIWSLVEVTGGIAGIEETLERGQITWSFDEFTNTLTVEENDPGVSFGLSEGQYDYSFENISNADFIFIDSEEYGSITINTSRFTIDQNITTTGTMADGFIYKFAR